MGTTLTGTTPQDTYDSLIKVTDNGPLSGTAKYLSDGLGNDSVLALSTARVGIGTASPSYKLNVITDDVAGRQNLTNINRTAGNLVTFTNPRYSVDSSMGLLLRVFPQSDARQGAGIIASGGALNGETDLDLFVSSGSSTSTSYSALKLKGDTGNVGIGTSSPAGNLHIASASDTGIRIQAGTSSLSYIDLADSASGTPAGSIAYNHIVDAIVFGVGGSNTERFRMTANGLCFNGDTAAANALDDYEEGTWTPTLTGSGSNPSYTATALGNYTKIGRQVTAQIDISISTYGAGSGSIRISLPFTVNGSMGYFQAACYVYGVDINGLYLTAEPNAGNSFATINQIQDDAAASGLPQSAIAAGDIIRTTVTYFV